MLGFLDNLRIGRRIVLGFVLPVIGLIAFSGFVIFERWLVVADTRSLIGMAELASDVGAVVHELQKERGSSSLFLASKGTQFGDRLAAQRKLTDTAAQRLSASITGGELAKLGGNFATALEQTRKGVDGRLDIRKRVDGQHIDSKIAMAEYSSVIKHLLDLVAQIAVATPDKRTAGLATAYLSFIEAKERAGQERATGSAGFAGGFDPALYKRFLSLQAQQETLLSLFERQAPDALAAMLRERAKSAVFTEVSRMREQGASIGGGDGGVPAPVWFEASTKRIDALKEIEDAITQELLATATHIFENARLLLMVQVASVLFGLGITFAAATVVTRGLTGPIVRLTNTMKDLANGNTSVTPEGVALTNELGDMARAVEIFRENRIKAIQLEADQRFEHEAKERRRVAIERLTKAFEAEASTALATVASASQEMRTTAEALDQGAKRMAEHTTAVSSAASVTSGNVQSVASAAEELSASIAEIGRRAAESANVSREAVNEAGHTNELVSGLAHAVKDIGDVVSLISDIASQTNLLALNATIEAARAGDAGKGFAVVANEVKGLANQTAKATDEIAGQVGAVQRATTEAVAAIEEISRTIAKISEIASAIAAAVEQQDATTRDIARNAQEAANGTLNVSNHVADVTNEAADTGSTADRVLLAADGLSEQSTILKASVERYLKGVAAA